MTNDTPAVSLSEGDRLHGFRVTRVTPLPDMRLVAYELGHEKSGARLLHLHAGDPENLFTIALRTPPPDDTGLPHILEHTVLCGSRKYPVKDPFVELLKTSLATFLNAMTYPDKTVYPCASTNEKDFFHIADVYADAVFHPNITESHFEQEGHHFDFQTPGDPSAPLVIKGIVYNEMKGAYSDLDGTIQRRTQLSICPDNAYGFDSGGDPDVIPTLTYERFVDFHRTYYHPSNSLIFLYGNIPTERHLAFLDRHYLSAFDRLNVDTSIAAQPRWARPRRDTVPYPIGPDEDAARKTAVVLTFLSCSATDALRTLAMQLLNDYLLGNSASPLRRALVDSKLGEDLTDSGYAAYQFDTFFTVGLKGTEAEHADAIETLVKRVCSEEATRGIDREKMEASFHRMEIASREIQPRYPLVLMDRVYRTWLYDADPLHILQMNRHLAEVRSRFRNEPGFMEKHLQEMISANPHYTRLTFVPDKGCTARREEAFRESMARRKARMTPQELEAVAHKARELHALQSSPNPPEALATLPRLCLADVPPDPFELATRVDRAGGRPVLDTDMFTNGLGYVSLAFDLSGLEDELLDYVPLFADALLMMGAAGLDYAAMAERQAQVTGGVSAGVSVQGTTEDAARVRPVLSVASKALDGRFPQMLEILSDRILRGDLTDLARLKDVVLQGRMSWRSDIIPSGNQYALLYASRNLSRNASHAERLSGLTQLRVYERLASGFDKDRDAVVDKLRRIRAFLRGRDRVTTSFVGNPSLRGALDSWLHGFLGSMEAAGPQEENPAFRPVLETRDGVATPAEVAFVATALPAVPADHPAAPALLLLSVHLSYGYLWNEVRVKRGAYGARAAYNPAHGLFGFSSYRDPCIRETLDSFRGAISHVIQEMDLSPAAVEQAIIGTVKTLDQPIRPAQAVGTALSRHLREETPEHRRRFRRRLLSLTGDDIRSAVETLLAPALNTAPVCVLSSRERLEEASKAMGAASLDIRDL